MCWQDGENYWKVDIAAGLSSIVTVRQSGTYCGLTVCVPNLPSPGMFIWCLFGQLFLNAFLSGKRYIWDCMQPPNEWGEQLPPFKALQTSLSRSSYIPLFRVCEIYCEWWESASDNTDHWLLLHRIVAVNGQVQTQVDSHFSSLSPCLKFIGIELQADRVWQHFFHQMSVVGWEFKWSVYKVEGQQWIKVRAQRKDTLCQTRSSLELEPWMETCWMSSDKPHIGHADFGKSWQLNACADQLLEYSAHYNVKIWIIEYLPIFCVKLSLVSDLLD